ncbi:hypothetical protein D3C87_1472380 [compost metagenome]
MITRAQAEALLTLAESLEACERVGLKVSEDDEGLWLHSSESGDTLYRDSHYDISSLSIRLAVNALIPKQET